MNPEHWRRAALITAALALVAAGSLAAQDVNTDEPASTDPAAPGAHHKHLEALTGRWMIDGQLTPAPGADPVNFRGGVMAEMILGGRFLKTEYKADLMGQAMLGFGLEGYDNVTGKHQGVWADTMGTALFTYEGTWSDDGKVLTSYGEFTNPENGQPVKMRTITTIKTSSTYNFEAAMDDGSGEYVTTLRMIYSRQ